jgi:hypothetical protein
MRVAVPPGATNIVAWLQGKRTSTAVRDGMVSFTLPASPGATADWALSWAMS